MSMTTERFSLSPAAIQHSYILENFPVNNKPKSFRKLVHGVGVNDAGYIVRPLIDGVKVMCPAYRAWKSMMTRCYSAKWHERYPTYLGVEMCEEWHSFTAFKDWWLANQVDGWHLDKDIIGGGCLYSPETCIFVPQWLNKFTIDRCAARGSCPIGVHYDKQAGKYRAQCNNPITGKKEHLGYFTSTEEANQEWLRCKMAIAAELKPMMDEIDPRIHPRIETILANSA